MKLVVTLLSRALGAAGVVVRSRREDVLLHARLERAERKAFERAQYLRGVGELVDEKDHAAAKAVIAVATGEREEIRA